MHYVAEWGFCEGVLHWGGVGAGLEEDHARRLLWVAGLFRELFEEFGAVLGGF